MRHFTSDDAPYSVPSREAAVKLLEAASSRIEQRKLVDSTASQQDRVLNVLTAKTGIERVWQTQLDKLKPPD